MDLKRFTGPQAGSSKYDLLTAMSVIGLNGSPGLQSSMLRLIALVTARYNWKSDEFSVGQRDLARMWAVDERTVKREIKRLTECSILLQLRPGVRGRVASYRLNMAEIFRLSAPYWDKIGPDFSERMAHSGRSQPATEDKVVRVDFRPRDEVAPVPEPWGRTLTRLAVAEPGLHQSWFSGLAFVGYNLGRLVLRAPSAFVGQYVMVHHLRPLQDMAAIEFPGLRRIEIIE